MALRVLLADESSTIKKVVQLTLQDFDVDVRSVSVGLDVLSVAKSFRPDIVMADVLLAKRSGYEVCHDLKNDAETHQIPVVLMWSGFMEIDEQKARLSGADRRIEKPFDPQSLRQIVSDLVKRTQNNPVSAFVQFPPLPEFQENRAAPAQEQPQPVQPKPAVKSVIPEVPTAIRQQIPQESDETALMIDDTDVADEWVQQPPAVQPVQPQQQAKPAAPQRVAIPVQAPQPAAEEYEEFQLAQLQPATHQKVAENLSAQVAKSVGSASSGISEDVAREEIQKWLATHMPAIAERIIREEINRLLQDSEQSIEA